MPKWTVTFDALKDMRQAYEDLAVYTSWGRRVAGEGFKRVASIPHSLGVAMLQIEPDIFIDRKKFFEWLRKHPEYMAYDNVGRRGPQ